MNLFGAVLTITVPVQRAGLAAWILEKFRTWTGKSGQPGDAVPREVLLTNLTLYWVTETATSAARTYYEAGPAPCSRRRAC